MTISDMLADTDTRTLESVVHLNDIGLFMTDDGKDYIVRIDDDKNPDTSKESYSADLRGYKLTPAEGLVLQTLLENHGFATIEEIDSNGRYVNGSDNHKAILEGKSDRVAVQMHAVRNKTPLKISSRNGLQAYFLEDYDRNEAEKQRFRDVGPIHIGKQIIYRHNPEIHVDEGFTGKHLRPTEFLVLQNLYDNRNTDVTYEDLFDAMDLVNDETLFESNRNNLRVNITSLRQKLDGLHIYSLRRKGYRLEL